jgi:hypothetical protein
MCLPHPEPYGVRPLGGTRQMTVGCARVQGGTSLYGETGCSSRTKCGEVDRNHGHLEASYDSWVEGTTGSSN